MAQELNKIKGNSLLCFVYKNIFAPIIPQIKPVLYFVLGGGLTCSLSLYSLTPTKYDIFFIMHSHIQFLHILKMN